MDQAIRNPLQHATQAARTLLEQEFAAQLEGTNEVLPDGTIPKTPGPHLDSGGHLVRQKLVEAIQHRTAGGQKAAEAVADDTREAAFTCLNRFVALKMLEARGLVQTCVSKGDQSGGFREFCGLASGLSELADGGYQLYLECLFDELSTEVKVLFDRRAPVSLLWPGRQALLRLLAHCVDGDRRRPPDDPATQAWLDEMQAALRAGHLSPLAPVARGEGPGERGPTLQPPPNLSTQDLLDFLFLVCRRDRQYAAGAVDREPSWVRAANEVRRRALRSREPDLSQDQLLRAVVFKAIGQLIKRYESDGCGHLADAVGTALAERNIPYPAVWQSLEAGERDELALSLALWPNRVVDQCAGDLALAQTHDLTRFFWYDDPWAKAWRRRESPDVEVQNEVAHRHKLAVKAALESLLSAPMPGGAKKRRKK